MSNKMQELLETLIPFIILGVAIALLLGLLVMFSYVLVWGLLIGGGLWLISVAKEYLFPSGAAKKDKGRVIEHDDKK